MKSKSNFNKYKLGFDLPFKNIKKKKSTNFRIINKR